MTINTKNPGSNAATNSSPGFRKNIDGIDPLQTMVPNTKLSSNVGQTLVPSLTTALGFIETVCPGYNPVIMTWPDEKPENRTTHDKYDSLEDIWPKIVEAQNRGESVFLMPNEGSGNGDIDFTAARSLYLDFDNGDLPSWFAEEFPPTAVVTTKNGKHYYWVFQDPETDKESYRELQDRIVEITGSDKNAKGICRVMRLPGTLHFKDLNDPVLTTWEKGPGETYNPTDFGGVQKPLPRTVQHVLEELAGLSKGDYDRGINEECFKLGVQVAKGTLSYENAKKLSIEALTRSGLSTKQRDIRKIEKALKEGQDKAYGSQPSNDTTPSQLKAKRFIDSQLEGKVTCNVRGRTIYVDGEEAHFESLYNDLIEATEGQGRRFSVSDKLLQNQLAYHAKQNEFDPVEDYLDTLPECKDPYGVIDEMTQRLGVPEDFPLGTIYLLRWLVSAVARVYEPGCKTDLVLVFQGKQGSGKTTTLATLAGEDNFTSANYSHGDKDALLCLHNNWIIELGEVESTFSKKGNSDLKDHISKTHDEFRRPYGKKSEQHPRRFVFAATTNQTQVLTDPTGSRRYLVLPTGQRIDTDWVKDNRDLIWGAAKALYISGEQWYLTRDEEEQQAALNEEFQSRHPWVEAIEEGMRNLESSSLYSEEDKAYYVFSTVQFARILLDVELNKVSNKERNILADTLNRLGYTYKKRTVNGKRRNVFADESRSDWTLLGASEVDIQKAKRIALDQNDSIGRI